MSVVEVCVRVHVQMYAKTRCKCIRSHGQHIAGWGWYRVKLPPSKRVVACATTREWQRVVVAVDAHAGGERAHVDFVQHSERQAGA